MSMQFVQPTVTPLLSQPFLPRAVKFDAAFLERRLRQHRAWQKSEALRLCIAVTREVLLLDPVEESCGPVS